MAKSNTEIDVNQDDGPGTATAPGTQLRKARLAAKLSVDDVALQLNIRKQLVLALEEDRYDQFQALIYAKGQVRSNRRKDLSPVKSLFNI